MRERRIRGRGKQWKVQRERAERIKLVRRTEQILFRFLASTTERVSQLQNARYFIEVLTWCLFILHKCCPKITQTYLLFICVYLRTRLALRFNYLIKGIWRALHSDKQDSSCMGIVVGWTNERTTRINQTTHNWQMTSASGRWLCVCLSGFASKIL